MYCNICCAYYTYTCDNHKVSKSRLRTAAELKEETVRRIQKEEADYYTEHCYEINVDMDRAINEIELAQSKGIQACHILPTLHKYVCKELTKSGYEVMDLEPTRITPAQTYVRWI